MLPAGPGALLPVLVVWGAGLHQGAVGAYSSGSGKALAPALQRCPQHFLPSALPCPRDHRPQVAASLAPAGPRLELLTALGLCQVSQGDLQASAPRVPLQPGL